MLHFEKQSYASPLDVFIGMGLLKPALVDDWRNGRVPYLERVIPGSLNKITFCMKCFHEWAREKRLKPSHTAYMRKTRGGKRDLRFSKSGNPSIEKSYCTHYVSPILAEIKAKKIQEKLENPPDLAIYVTTMDSQCAKCERKLRAGKFLFRESGQSLCLCCANLSEFAFLPKTNRRLTRQVHKEGIETTRVVKFSGKRYELQGILVEKKTLQRVYREIMADDDDIDWELESTCRFIIHFSSTTNQRSSTIHRLQQNGLKNFYID